MNISTGTIGSGQKGHPLDNTAHLFPAVASEADSHVFRLTILLRDPVEPELLQLALEQTLPNFGAFQVRLCSGLFWNQLQHNSATPHVKPENDIPCRYIHDDENEQFHFRVLHYQNRIHLETFHVLTDATGALSFLKALCYCYCRLRYPHELPPAALQDDNSELSGALLDGYKANLSAAKRTPFMEREAFHLSGPHRSDMSIMTLLLPLKQLKQLGREQSATIGEYLTAVIADGLRSAYMQSSEAALPVNITVPVNLRPLFSTESALNFFATMIISLPGDQDSDSWETTLTDVKRQFKEKTTADFFRGKFTQTVRGEHHPLARIIPLAFKECFLQLSYRICSGSSTLAFSNLGRVCIEPEYAPFVEGFRFLLPTSSQEPVKISACSYGDTLTLSITSKLSDHRLASDIVRRLKSAGVSMTIEMGGETE